MLGNSEESDYCHLICGDRRLSSRGICTATGGMDENWTNGKVGGGCSGQKSKGPDQRKNIVTFSLYRLERQD